MPDSFSYLIPSGACASYDENGNEADGHIITREQVKNDVHELDLIMIY